MTLTMRKFQRTLWSPAVCAAVLWAIFFAAISHAEEMAAEEQELEEVVVTGTKPYYDKKATSGTKIATPTRDVPQSIQVVPAKVIEDQNAVRTNEIVQNVSGVRRGNTSFGDTFMFRGFEAGGFAFGLLRDGYPDRTEANRDPANIERVEVLKGPASVLYGRLHPGGTINYVTKQPLFSSGFVAGVTADSEGLVRPTFDLNSVGADGKIGLRVNGAVEHGENFRDFSFSDRDFIATVLAWRPREGTRFSVEFESLDDRRLFDRGIPHMGSGPAPIPVSRFVGEPTDYISRPQRLYGYTLDQSLGSVWKIRHAVRASGYSVDDARTQMRVLNATTGNLTRDFRSAQRDIRQITGQLELMGDVKLVGLGHKLLVGVDFDHFNSDNQFFIGSTATTPGINIFNPIYGQFTSRPMNKTTDADDTIRAQALYVQDLIELTPRWKALLGARLDDVNNRSENRLTSKTSEADDTEISPRAGLVWQPVQVLSLYTSYSQSFIPALGTNFSGELFKPERGKQLEAGAKNEWFGGRLAATTAVFQIKKQNIRVPDPVNAGFNIQTGEVTSEGVEFDVSGSLLPGLNMIGNFALTDARITKDTRANVLDRRPANVPMQSAGLWTSYELPQGRRWWNGLGGGAGAYYVGRRAGIDTGIYYLPSFTRWDAGMWYDKERWRFSLKMNNVFDKVYYESTLTTFGIYPGAPRTVLASASYRL